MVAVPTTGWDVPLVVERHEAASGAHNRPACTCAAHGFTGIGSRADRSIIRNNHIEDADGAGVRLGGHEVDGYQYGVDNQVSLFGDVAASVIWGEQALAVTIM